MQSDSVMLQFQPVLVKKKINWWNFQVKEHWRLLRTGWGHSEPFFVNWRVININQSTGQLLAGYFCLFVCLFVCFPLFSHHKKSPENSSHTVHTTFRFECPFIIGLGWIVAPFGHFLKPPVGRNGVAPSHRFPATSRGVRTFSVVFLLFSHGHPWNSGGGGNRRNPQRKWKWHLGGGLFGGWKVGVFPWVVVAPYECLKINSYLGIS